MRSCYTSKPFLSDCRREERHTPTAFKSRHSLSPPLLLPLSFGTQFFSLKHSLKYSHTRMRARTKTRTHRSDVKISFRRLEEQRRGFCKNDLMMKRTESYSGMILRTDFRRRETKTAFPLVWNLPCTHSVRVKLVLFLVSVRERF